MPGIFLYLIFGIFLLYFNVQGKLDVQENQIKKCQAELKLDLFKTALKFNEIETANSNNNYVKLCMEKNDFVFNFGGKYCQPLVDQQEYLNKFCYRSASFPYLTSIDIAIHNGYEDPVSTLWCEKMRTISIEYCSKHGWFSE